MIVVFFFRTYEKQIRLFDIRQMQKHKEVQYFGWKQDNVETQSALVNQDWSPSGLHLSSGSADPKIHIFDIRYKGKKPYQSIKAHEKRVFSAKWPSSKTLISIAFPLQQITKLDYTMSCRGHFGQAEESLD